MPHPALEVAEIFRTHGAAWRAAHAGHISVGQLKVMSAIEACRTAALGGHVERVSAVPVRRSPIIAAATGTAPNAKGRRPGTGSLTAKPNCCACRTSMWCSRCRQRSAIWPGTTRRWFMICC